MADERSKTPRQSDGFTCGRCGSSAVETATDVVRGWRLGYCHACGTASATSLNDVERQQLLRAGGKQPTRPRPSSILRRQP